MNTRRAYAVLGFQIAFLAFAAVLLAAPADKFIFSHWQWARDLELPLGRPMIFVIAAILLAAIRPLRQQCAAMLAVPTQPGVGREIALGILMNFIASVGAIGAFALWVWSVGGEPALARSMGERASHAVEMERALSTSSVVMFVFFGAAIVPVIEELVFRGMLYSAWKQAWGWVWGALGSALVFGLFHGAVLPQFLAGLVLVCVVRRTGSLRGSIYTHAAFNLLLWYPLLGQFTLPAGRSTGEIRLWWPHFICLALTLILLPWYMGSARDSRTRVG